VTMVERKSGFGVIVKVANKTSELVSRAIVEGLQSFANRVKTLTYDNGKEFAAHIQIDQEPNSMGYFAKPFASWERGSIEKLNGLLPKYVPKKRLMNTVDEDEITMIQNRLNNRPRKIFVFITPAEVFHQSLKRAPFRT
jgi:IS30 family transposase